MNRCVLEKMLCDQAYKIPVFTDSEVDKIIDDTLDFHAEIMDGKRGLFDLIKLQEECNELSETVSDIIFNKGDWNDYLVKHLPLIEEMSDVILCIEIISRLLNIDQDTLSKMCAIKMDRVRQRVEKYQEEKKKDPSYDPRIPLMK